MARKEQEKCYKKVVKNPMLYLEEHYHQINPAEHQLEVHSMRFFGAGAESATIEVLAIIDWATEFLELSCSPVPEIPAFLWRPFMVSKKVQFPIPEDPGDAIHKEKCVCTKAQKAWVYLCTLLQFWTNEAMMESGEIMYGGWHRPTNPMIARIRAMLNPSLGNISRLCGLPLPHQHPGPKLISISDLRRESASGRNQAPHQTCRTRWRPLLNHDGKRTSERGFRKLRI